MTLPEIARELFDAVRPSRVTIRGDPTGDATELRAEILAAGVPTMVGAPTDEIPNAPTYLWLREHRRPLVQADCRADPLPPRMLTEHFGVGAQMLGPLFIDADMVASISVHQMGGPRHWSATEVQALANAVDQLRRLWGMVDVATNNDDA